MRLTWHGVYAFSIVAHLPVAFMLEYLQVMPNWEIGFLILSSVFSMMIIYGTYLVSINSKDKGEG